MKRSVELHFVRKISVVLPVHSMCVITVCQKPLVHIQTTVATSENAPKHRKWPQGRSSLFFRSCSRALLRRARRLRPVPRVIPPRPTSSYRRLLISSYSHLPLHTRSTTPVTIAPTAQAPSYTTPPGLPGFPFHQDPPPATTSTPSPPFAAR